jgi:hypothetical protein
MPECAELIPPGEHAAFFQLEGFSHRLFLREWQMRGVG